MKTLSVFRKLQEKVTVLCNQLNLKKHEQATGRPRSLSIIETVTLSVYKHTQGIPTKKAVGKDFGLRCAYKTFIVSISRLIIVIAQLLLAIMRENRRHAHVIKYTDATAIAVCLNKNAKYHKTMRTIAEWGRGSKGYFYGLKLHISADYKGRLLSSAFTPANTDERTQFMKLNKDLYGLFIADAGYISAKLAKEFNRENRRLLMVKPKRNMKKMATPLQHALYNTRSLVERHFNNMKKFYNLVNTLSRSI